MGWSTAWAARWGTGADRIRQFPARVTAAGQQLRDADPTTEREHSNTGHIAGQRQHDTRPTTRQARHDTGTTARRAESPART
ncbi:hypothetical protein ACWCHM_06220 [Micromonospora sp. SCSIO 07396]